MIEINLKEEAKEINHVSKNLSKVVSQIGYDELTPKEVIGFLVTEINNLKVLVTSIDEDVRKFESLKSYEVTKPVFSQENVDALFTQTKIKEEDKSSDIPPPSRIKRKEDVAGLDLSKDLVGADLYGAVLVDVCLVSANLKGANLSYAYLRGADLSYAYLRGSDLRYANLAGADLSHANLAGADLRYATLENVNLTGVDVSGADLLGVNTKGAIVDDE